MKFNICLSFVDTEGANMGASIRGPASSGKITNTNDYYFFSLQNSRSVIIVLWKNLPSENVYN